MKVAFIQTLPIMTDAYLILSAVLKKRGIGSEVFVEAFDNDFVNNIVNSGASLIGFNVLTGSYNWAFSIAKKIKKIKNVPIIFGGVHPTFYPETIDFSIVDYICIGEGENALVDLAEAIRDNKKTENIDNIGLLQNGKLKINPPRPIICDLSVLPFYNRELYNKYNFFDNLEVYKYHTSRACPYRCSFCFVTNQAKLYKGQKIFREYPVNYVIKELLGIKNDYKKLKAIFFTDETFGVNKEWAYELLNAYKEKINLPYTITTRANLLNEDFIELLRSTNCQMVSMSVETANEELREKVMHKKISNQAIIDAGKQLYKAGIKTRVNCIFCIPDETINDALKNVEFMKQAKVTDPVGFLLQPFPKTDIYDYAVQKGYIKNKMSIDDFDPLVYFRTPMDIPDKKKIIIVQRLFVYACKIPYFDKLLRVLIKFPNNIIFDTMQKIAIALSHKRFYGLSFMGLIKFLLSAKKFEAKTSA